MGFTSAQRFFNALEGAPSDHVPILPLLAGWAAQNFSNGSHPDPARLSDRIAQIQIQTQDSLGFDGLFGYLDPLYIPEAFGCNVRTTGSGPVVEPLSSISLDTVEGLERLPRPNPEQSGRLPVILAAVHQLAEYSRRQIPVIGLFEGPFTTACRVLETDRILRLAYKNKPVLAEVLDRFTDFLLGFGRSLSECGAHALLIPEPTASASMISPRMFEEWALPRLQQLTQNLDLPCILHICGNTFPLLKSMSQSGAGVLSLDQCMDLRQSRINAPHATLGGNVDPVKSLLLGSVEAVRQDVLHCLESAGTEKFILMSGCSIPPQTPEENLRTMIQTAREYGRG